MAIDLSTSYLGLTLANPVVVAASPMSSKISTLMLLEQAGAGAAVMMSLFQEQIEASQHELQRARRVYRAEPGGGVCMPRLDDYNCGLDSYLRHLEAARRAVSMPIIASINASAPGNWTRFAGLLQSAGADALELNIYFVPIEADVPSSEVEDRYVELAAAVRAEITIPLAVKLANCFTSLPFVARRLAAAGAAGLVLFNRPLEPDIDLASYQVQPTLWLSRPEELRARLRWISILRRQLNISLAGTGGVESADDVVKLILAGADVAMIASALFRHGPQYLTVILDSLTSWLEARGFASLAPLRGLLELRTGPDANVLQRVNYMYAVTGNPEVFREAAHRP